MHNRAWNRRHAPLCPVDDNLSFAAKLENTRNRTKAPGNSAVKLEDIDTRADLFFFASRAISEKRSRTHPPVSGRHCLKKPVLAALTMAVIGLVVLDRISAQEPREITPRGALAPDEERTIACSSAFRPASCRSSRGAAAAFSKAAARGPASSGMRRGMSSPINHVIGRRGQHRWWCLNDGQTLLRPNSSAPRHPGTTLRCCAAPRKATERLATDRSWRFKRVEGRPDRLCPSAIRSACPAH